MTYNIIHQPFLKATYLDGRVHEIGIEQAFTDAEQIVNITGDNEIQEFTLMRTLIAVLYGALPKKLIHDSEDWINLWESGLNKPTNTGKTIQEYVHEYLKIHEHRFNLAGNTPFMSVAEATYKKHDSSTGTEQLFVDNIKLPKTNHAHYSSHDREFFKEIEPSVAARALIEIQTYRPGSKKSIFADDPRTSKIGYAQPGWGAFLGGMLLKGANLAEHLLLNTPPYEFLKSDGEDNDFTEDKAAWEGTQDTSLPNAYQGKEEKIGKAKGPKQILTHQPARVQLLWKDSKIVGCKIGIGDRIFTQDSQLAEPHATQYLAKSTQQEGVTFYRPRKLGTKPLWKGLPSLLAIDSTMNETAGVKKAPNLSNYQTVANEIDLPFLNISHYEISYGTQDAIIEEIMVSHLSLPATVYDFPDISALISTAVNQADEILTLLLRFQKSVQATLASRPSVNTDSITSNFTHQAGSIFRSWVRTINTNNLKEKQDEWSQKMKELASEMIHQTKLHAPTEAFFPPAERKNSAGKPVISLPEAERIFWATTKKRKVFI